MYGGPSSKLGRAAPKRLHSSFPPPPSHRQPAPSSGRLSLGGSARNSGKATAPAVEESFSLVSGSNPLAFSMIIRLAPDLVDEIKRVEAQGGKARMKFDPNPNNPNGNIIDVGGKSFSFTWSREFGDLCDIYEERRSGEDGNGLLVESGCAWRKLNVQRILDESTKNLVKMRSEEADIKKKSRKAIVLEPGNPSMKSQLKALAAVESTPWKNYNKKKEAAMKKRKVKTLQVGGPPKTTHRSGLPSTTTNKGRHSSPFPSPPDHLAASTSPPRAVNFSKSLDDSVHSQMTGMQDANAIPEKEIPTRTNNAMRNTPRGKALEKADGDTLPNSTKKIEPIIKKGAKYHAPGRSILRPEVDLESIKKPRTEIRSSPDDNRRHTPARQEFHDQTSGPQGGSEERVTTGYLVESVHVKSKLEEESNTFEKVDAQHNSPDIFSDKKGSDHSEVKAGSSSDSDTDSETDSTDTGSDSGSHSRSRSRSPARTGTSSSDSESDASSSSKEGLEGSDEEVDIMTSTDEKDSKRKTEDSDQMVSLPFPVKSPDGRSLQNEVDEKQDGNDSDAVEIEKDFPEEQEAEMVPTAATISNEGGKYAEETKLSSPDYQQIQEQRKLIGRLFDEKENEVKDSSRYEQSDSSDRLSKSKHKRVSDVKNIDEKSEHKKRLKSENLTQEPFAPGMDAHMLESSHNISPVEFTEDTYKEPTIQAVNRADTSLGNSNAALQKGYSRAFPGKSTSDIPQTGQRSFDQTSLGNISNPFENSAKHGGSLRHSRKLPVREGSSMKKDKPHVDVQNEEIHATERKVARNSRDRSNGSKQSLYQDSHYQKPGEMVGMLKEGRQDAQSYMGTSPKGNSRIGVDKSPVINGRGISLQREPSDLELGELRESTPDESHIAKQFERKGSFKRSENRVSTSEDRNSDVVKVNPPLKAVLGSRKPSPAIVGYDSPNNVESMKQKIPDNHFEDSTRSHSRVMQSHSQHLKADHLEVGSRNKLAEMNSKFRSNESGIAQDNDLEGRSESNRRAPANAYKKENKRGIAPYPVKESNSVDEMADGGKDSVLADRNNGDQKKRESSSDENSCSFSKYEKDEPELKGPILTFSQYQEYVQEYRDKYDSYLSLNKIFEGYRDEFQKLGDDLEDAKGRDMNRYYDIVEQLRESYRRCGPRHKRLKKIFNVLHKEIEQLKRRIKDFAESYNKD
ncbi:PREDICTED: dentin sialophosphoprotein-like [Lupinus angustifolius]|uniref:dentin sialophosphoprotein-like n=1 Tax=Lupinus angustifolius TaxID=3871 RepID=UPI00092E8DDC|nr:PREDICTED: dentin sialophosphoprotein-like [Lupinus angustifolius]